MTTSNPSPLIRPFTVAIPDSEIDDLRQRLARTRWPDAETVSDWSQGVRVENARALVDYWQHQYDWRRFERELNGFPQFVTEIDGLDIHFIHVRSANANAMPLILTHGWPGSIVEFLHLIGPLTDPEAYGGDVGGLVRRRHPVAAGVRVLGQADRGGVERDADRERVGGADGASRLRQVGRPGRRLGRRRDDRPRSHAA